MEEQFDFDFNEVLNEFRNGKRLTGKDGLLAPLIKQLTEAALEAEVESHIAQDVLNGNTNRRNGVNRKTIKGTSDGSFELETPRDRNGTFEPQIVKKHQTTLSYEIEEKILSMYGLGMSYTDITKHIEEIYQVSISTATISTITDKIIDKVKQWQARPLDSIYPFVWLDAIHYKIKEGGKYVSKAVYTVLGVNMEGKKDILGLYLSESEGANFWLSVLTDLNNRGLQDILIASVDGLKGFPEAINSTFPDAKIQLCIVHMVRNSLKLVPWKDYKAVTADLKRIYQSISEQEASLELDRFVEKWDDKYPQISKSWRTHWVNLITIFDYPADIRKVIYTTNAIESLNSVIRKSVKTRKVFPSDDAALKVVFLAIEAASKKWTMPIRNWKPALNRFMIEFEEQLAPHI